MRCPHYTAEQPAMSGMHAVEITHRNSSRASAGADLREAAEDSEHSARVPHRESKTVIGEVYALGKVTLGFFMRQVVADVRKVGSLGR